tara:strand:+ start:278 stop:526 length:249 start_codon:yes stop_codon:yes gene_type:complete
VDQVAEWVAQAVLIDLVELETLLQFLHLKDNQVVDKELVVTILVVVVAVEQQQLEMLVKVVPLLLMVDQVEQEQQQILQHPL